METLITGKFFFLSTPLFPQSLPPLYFVPFPSKNSNLFRSVHQKLTRYPRSIAGSCSVSASSNPIQSNYGGWDDLELLDESMRSGKLDSVRSFLVSLGTDDRKHVFLFLLGFFSALVVSRVRSASIVVLPISVLVFVIGFLAGMNQSRSGKNGGNFRVFDEKVRDLELFLNDLKKELEGGTSLNRLDVSTLENYLEAIDNAKKTVVDSIGSELLNGRLSFDLEGGKKLNSKSGRKRRVLGVTGSDFIQFIGGLFQENLTGERTPKTKDITKEQLDSAAKDDLVVGDSVQESITGNGKEERVSNLFLSSDLKSSTIEEGELLFNKNLRKVEAIASEKGKAIKTALKNDHSVGINNKKADGSKDNWSNRDMLSYDEELNKINRSFQYMTKQESFEKMVLKHKYEERLLQSDIHDSTESIDFLTADTRASLISERAVGMTSKSYSFSHRSKMGNFTEEGRTESEDISVKGNQEPMDGVGEGNRPLSSTVSVDEKFHQYMQEATDLLKQARKCMKSQADEEMADAILYKSAKLLSAAVAVRPMSLLAVGQLGNTYLLHGELKLKISRELRTLLLRSDALLNRKSNTVRFKKMDTCDLSREDITSVLVEVCEECEELLVEAGRKYRLALSIDGNDVRALYNWGLALSFRAQLIADIGPEAAFDADKVYLAAIDKFDALTSRSTLHAVDALYRWGIALQQRSHLRPRKNKEKLKLLQQAKSLFEDVLSRESDNLQVREALVSCVSELNYNGQW